MVKGKLRKWWDELKLLPRRTNVEPIIVLVYFGYVFGNTVQSPEIYRRICQIYYDDDPTVNCYNISQQSVEDDVQAHSAEWTLYNALAYLVPAIFADTLLGAYGDRNGRKINILLGICGLVVTEYGYMLTLSNSVATPFWTTTVLGVFTGFTGYVAMIPVSCYAYLADITHNPSDLTIRSGVFSVLQTSASVLGGLLAGVIHSHIGIAVAINIELAFIVAGFLYTLFRIPQTPGLHEIERRARVTTNTSQSSVRQVASFVNDVSSLYKEAYHTYRRERVGHRRAFMFITVVVLMLTYTTSVETRTTGVGSVINNFVFRRTDSGSLGWDSEDLGYWNGMGYLMLIVGTLFGVGVFKKLLDFRETTLILIGILSSTLRTIIIGIATDDWMMYLANGVGMFAGLVQPAVVSFMTQIVAGSEIGRTFALFGIGADAAFILTAAVYTNIYRWTVSWFPGFTFLLIAAFQSLAFLAMLWVYFKAKQEGVGDLPKEARQSMSNNVEETQQNGKDRTKPWVFSIGQKKKQVSIKEHAEGLDRNRRDAPIWCSSENLARDRVHSMRVY